MQIYDLRTFNRIAINYVKTATRSRGVHVTEDINCYY